MKNMYVSDDLNLYMDFGIHKSLIIFLSMKKPKVFLVLLVLSNSVSLDIMLTSMVEVNCVLLNYFIRLFYLLVQMIMILTSTVIKG